MRMLAAALTCAAVCAWGCAVQEESWWPGGAATEETAVQPMEEYREEAAREITAENAEEELARLEREIEADIRAGD